MTSHPGTSDHARYSGQVTNLAGQQETSSNTPRLLRFHFSIDPTDLQSAVEEAAVLSRLVAQALAGCDRSHGSRGHQPLGCSAARRKVVPLPRHHYLDIPVSTVRWRWGAEDQAVASMSLPWERQVENEEKEEEGGGGGGRRRL